ncbi:MAG TPA: LptA/OstA family protein [Thermoanaerobaculia bacterium]|nr:LptA/OstA family protein [Thermoanaerobaculia bacterium]
MATRSSRPIRVLRTISLFVFVGSVLGVVGLLWFGTAGKPEVAAGDQPAAPAGAVPRAVTENIAIEGENFRQAVTQGERVLFEIQGGRYRADRQDNVFLEDVQVSVAREEGVWHLRGDSGRFNRQSKEARLEGEVSVSGPSGLDIAARWLDLRQGGKVLVASRGTSFRLRDSLEGESEHLRMDLERQVTVLSDGVLVRGLAGGSRPPFELAANRIVFDRTTHRLDAEGDVRLRARDGSLDTRRLTVQLDGEDRRVLGLRALWEVDGWLRRPVATAGAPSAQAATATSALERVSFEGTTLAIDLDAEERPVHLHLEGSATAQATLETAQTGGITHRTRAPEMIGAFSEGRLSSLLARRPVELEERRNGQLSRVGRARRALAAFDELGRMVRVDLEERVALVGDDLTANGDRASLLILDETVTLWGAPVQVQRRGDSLSAPEVVHSAKLGTLEARGGVRATMTPREGADLLGSAAFGDAEGPVMVEARDAVLREAEDEVLFRGGVRAWRGASLVLADQLRGNRAGESLAASGSVRTVWRPEAGALAESEAEQTPPSGRDSAEARRRRPVEITARHLTYVRSEGVLRYENDVAVTQGGQTVTCQELLVELDAEQRPERYDCSGQARVVDLDLARKVEGSRVVYRPESGEVEVTGEPVRLEDPKLRIEGPKLWYSVEDEKVHMGTVPPHSVSPSPAANGAQPGTGY